MTLGFVFPGQGAQSVGMLSDIAAAHPQVADDYRQAGEAIGVDLWDLVSNGPAERLNSTEITQPALLVASASLWRLWAELGGAVPTMLAGHSLGEYSACLLYTSDAADE